MSLDHDVFFLPSDRLHLRSFIRLDVISPLTSFSFYCAHSRLFLYHSYLVLLVFFGSELLERDPTARLGFRGADEVCTEFGVSAYVRVSS